MPPIAYHDLVEQSFGPGSWLGAAAVPDGNPVVGALSAQGYDNFKANLTARLARLATGYSGHASLNDLLQQVREVANVKNWEGAFAELTAYDFFTASSEFASRLPVLNVSIPGTRTLTSRLGNTGPANLDVHFSEFDVFTDVKVLKDNVSDIIEAIYRKVAFPTPKPLIVAEYPPDASYEDLQRNLAAIASELGDELNSGAKSSLIKIQVVPDLAFRVDWSARMVITDGAYSPYRHAQEAHRLPFLHAKKFVVDRPFFLTFVVHPWFNNKITTFADSNRTYYRSLSRRVFCQYRHSIEQLSQVLPKYRGTESLFDVSKLLAGLLFLEDRTVSSDDPSSVNAEGFWYSNPNALHPIDRTLMGSFLHSLPIAEQDDFAFDNY